MYTPDDSAIPYIGMQTGHNRQNVEAGPDAPYAMPRSERIRLNTQVDGYTIHVAYRVLSWTRRVKRPLSRTSLVLIINQWMLDAVSRAQKGRCPGS